MWRQPTLADTWNLQGCQAESPDSTSISSSGVSWVVVDEDVHHAQQFYPLKSLQDNQITPMTTLIAGATHFSTWTRGDIGRRAP
jgi:hypothetical protein